LHEMADTINSGLRALEESNADLESFSYSVSHDLRAPLRAIGGYAMMLEEDYGSQLEGDAARFLEVIKSESRRMGELIDDLLTFSRIGRSQLTVSRVDMEALAREAFLEVSRDARLRIEGDLPHARADRKLFHQVFVNLFSNAVKFSRDRPSIVVELSAERRADFVVYRIHDHGVG